MTKVKRLLSVGLLMALVVLPFCGSALAFWPVIRNKGGNDLGAGD